MTTPDFDEIARLGTSADELTQPINTPDPGRPINVGSEGRARTDQPAELDPGMVEKARAAFEAMTKAMLDAERRYEERMNAATTAALSAANVPGLIAEVERLRYDLDHSYSQREWSALTARATSAEQERDRLRADAVEVARALLDERGQVAAEPAAHRILAGSGEQPGACDRSGEWCRTHREAWPCQAGLMAGTLTTDDVRPAPVAPDSPDVRVVDAARIIASWTPASGREAISAAQALAHKGLLSPRLAVVGQGVTAEQAWDEGYAAGLRDAPRGEPGGTPNPRRAAVRPTGQEQADG